MTNAEPTWNCSDCGTPLPDGKPPCPSCGSSKRTASLSLGTTTPQEVNARTYVARATGNPIANTVFLAAQAIIHPNRTLFMEVWPGDDKSPPVWTVVPRDNGEAERPSAQSRVSARAGDVEASADLRGVGHVEAKADVRGVGVALREHKPAATPTLTPAFNYALLIVLGFTVAAFVVEIAMGFLLGDHITDAQKTLSTTADWILKSGIGAFLGLLGSKSLK